MTWQVKMAKAQQLLEDARTILQNEKASQEEKNRVPLMIEDAKKLKEEAASLKSIEQIALEMEAAEVPLVEAKRQAHAGAQQEPAPEGFKNWYDFVEAVKNMHYYGVQDSRLEKFRDTSKAEIEKAGRKEQKALAAASGALGGFLIPGEQYGEIMQIAATQAVVRPRATILPMSSRTLEIMLLDQTSTSTDYPAWFGGMEVFFVEESAQNPESEPQWRSSMMTAHDMVVYSRIPDSLLEDAPALAAWLQSPMGMPGAIAWKEDYVFLRGTGVGQPQGVIGAPATKVVARQNANEIDYTDLTNMLAGVWGNDGNLVWVASISAKAKLLQMNGPTGNPSYLWGNAENGMPRTLLGYPIFWTDKTPALGSEGDIGLYDFTYYVVGDRKSTTVEMSREERFRYNQTAMRAVHRVDGQPWISTVITLIDGTTTVSPFVVLGAPST